VTIVWADGAVQKTWLQVTVLAGGATGLARNDVFYFGNAVGESGDLSGAAFVDGTDFAGARDNPRNFLDRAPLEFAYDYNRDSFVDGFDLAIARDNGTNFLTALKLIAAPGASNRPEDIPLAAPLFVVAGAEPHAQDKDESPPEQAEAEVDRQIWSSTRRPMPTQFTARRHDQPASQWLPDPLRAGESGSLDDVIDLLARSWQR
jgi:hypothetical protein